MMSWNVPKGLLCVMFSVSRPRNKSGVTEKADVGMIMQSRMSLDPSRLSLLRMTMLTNNLFTSLCSGW